NESLIVRIEDMDTAHNIEGKDKEILEILGLFGIEYTDAIYQSANLRFHRSMAIQLLQDKKAFNCFCTPAELDRKRELAEEKNSAFRYDDTCTHLPPEETIDNENPFTVRFRKPEHAVEVIDLVKGECTFTPDDIDSFIILRADKLPTGNFACAIDDMLNDISLVIRDEDRMENTPRQIAVREALGYDKKVEYAHLPLILDDKGTSVKHLLEEGFLPEAIGNYLILIGNKTPEEIFTIAEAVEWFDLKNISDTPAPFDIEKLKLINREHLKRMDVKELSRYVGFADDDIGQVARIFLEEAYTTKELRAKIEPIFEPKSFPEEFAESAATMREVINAGPFFEDFEEFKAHVMTESGLEGEKFSKTLQILLTGAQDGPEVADLYPYLKNYIGEIIK
ncbi:MAG: glutamate--tRNA ligase, partial [Sulfurimonadaceae bacterium]|nr:glutamate--tRNA ligase [Sulfurimonadaceae bacterium]